MKFDSHTLYSLEEIEEMSGFRSVRFKRFNGSDCVAVTDVKGDFSQYEFRFVDDERLRLIAVDGEEIK